MAVSADYFFLDLADPERLNALTVKQLREMVTTKRIHPTVIVVNEQTGESGPLNELVNLKTTADGVPALPSTNPLAFSLTTALGLIMLGTMVIETLITGHALGNFEIAVHAAVTSKINWIDTIAGVSLLLGNLLPARWTFVLKLRFIIGIIVSVIGFIGAPFLSKFFVWAEISGAPVALLLGGMILYNLGMFLAVNHHGAQDRDDASRGWSGVWMAGLGVVLVLGVYGYWNYTGELRHAVEKMIRMAEAEAVSQSLRE